MTCVPSARCTRRASAIEIVDDSLNMRKAKIASGRCSALSTSAAWTAIHDRAKTARARTPTALARERQEHAETGGGHDIVDDLTHAEDLLREHVIANIEP